MSTQTRDLAIIGAAVAGGIVLMRVTMRPKASAAPAADPQTSSYLSYYAWRGQKPRQSGGGLVDLGGPGVPHLMPRSPLPIADVLDAQGQPLNPQATLGRWRYEALPTTWRVPEPWPYAGSEFGYV